MYLARWGGVGCCVLDRRVRARSEDPTHGNGEPRAKKKMAANFFPRFFSFRPYVVCWLPLLPRTQLTKAWHEVSTLENALPDVTGHTRCPAKPTGNGASKFGTVLGGCNSLDVHVKTSS